MVGILVVLVVARVSADGHVCWIVNGNVERSDSGHGFGL